jgi:hypothetical protein
LSRASLTLGKDLKKLVETLDKKNCRGPNGWASAAVTQQAKFAESIFAESLCLRPLCQGPGFAEGSWGWPLAKTVFAECPRFGPRQSLRPLAKRTFPAVIVPEFARSASGSNKVARAACGSARSLRIPVASVATAATLSPSSPRSCGRFATTPTRSFPALSTTWSSGHRESDPACRPA